MGCHLKFHPTRAPRLREASVQRRQRPCLDCRKLTRNASRCDQDQAAWQARQNQLRGSATQRGYDSKWQRVARAAVALHRAEHGDWCPGWGVPAHASTDLTADHRVPLARGGTSEPENVCVLCRSCNSRKRDQ
ncbi:HNH endonuclease [Kitasatospora sp. NPDC051164]|uniref:HNH endonuclease n=1 Tax=Kitasatospora sp. NPDC051164 TaxID=3364055 RepID=UPI0037B681F7